MKIIKNGGDEILDSTYNPTKCVNCGKLNYFVDNICGVCVDLVPNYIPEEQWKTYFLLKNNK